MAEVFLSPLLQVIFENMASLFMGKVRGLTGIRKEIEELMTTVRRIQACLHDAEATEATEEVVRLWLKELKDVGYEADDVIDKFTTELLAMTRWFYNFTQEGQLRYNINGTEIKEVREKMEKIMNEGSKLRLGEGVTKKRKRIGIGERPRTHSFVIESEIYGRAEDRDAIVSMLVEEGYRGMDEDLSVIPIVGLGGIGKTTLAQLAYRDERVVDHFEKRVWVCVSQDFDVKRVIKAIIESITGQQPRVSEMDPLARLLLGVLRGRRYLLVLDDVWNENVDKWNCMKTLLRSCASKGSKIIVTTRNEKVALIMGTTNPYHLGVLSNRDCWSLFKKRASFGGETENAHPNLVPIAWEISRKCKGVPLAAATLGSMMFLNTQENYWVYVRDCEMWNLPEDENGILPALRLSYNHLPAHLKRCFAYCSIFPKDYRIVKETLIQQWIAQGFIQSSNGRRLVEDVGSAYFDDMLRRLFFQGEQDIRGNMYYKMHHLIHDLAQSVTKDYCLILDTNNQTIIRKSAHYLSLLCGRNPIMPSSFYGAKSLRTLLILNYRAPFELPSRALEAMFKSFRCLRVLTITNYCERELPDSIDKLIHLRYFDISLTSIEKLPGSTRKLKNLQTLILGRCIRELPQNLSSFKNLRYLDVSRCVLLTFRPYESEMIPFLQSLPRFIE